MPARLLAPYFRKQEKEWQVRDEVRGMVEFRRINLIEPWPLGAQDVVMLRNVLIYFEPETRRRIVGRMAEVVAPDGALFLGSSETMLSLSDSYDRPEVERSYCYRPRPRSRPSRGLVESLSGPTPR